MFVPYVPPSPPPSPEARSLGYQVAQLVREWRQHHPTANLAEVRQALRLAEAELRQELGGSSSGQPAIVAVTLGLVLMAALGLFMMLRSTGAVSLASPAPIAMVLGVLAIVAGVAMVLKGRS